MFTDYHTHTPLCHHAQGWPRDYAQAAVERGLDELGLADHSPMPARLEPFDDWRMSLADLPRYFEAVDEARAAFPQLPIRLGLEVDYLPGHEAWIEELSGMARWDYLIGSVHYIAPGWDIDNPAHISRFESGSVEEIWELYFKALEACVHTRAFDFIAHPDLPKKFGHRPKGDLRRFYEPVIAALAETGTAFEINTAGLRKPAGECYPDALFLRLAHEAGARLLINSDAHAPAEVGANFADALALAKAAGFTELVRLEGRRKTLIPLQ
ncbi:MAG: histidinol-phosphatase [Chthoniobacteraceae bacterium]